MELWQLFHEGLPTYIKEIATSLLPIIAMFGVFQLAALRLDRRTLGRIGVGLAYTYIGLVLFLAGANIGFMPAGNYLGQVLAGQSFRWLLVPIGMLIGNSNRCLRRIFSDSNKNPVESRRISGEIPSLADSRLGIARRGETCYNSNMATVIHMEVL